MPANVRKYISFVCKLTSLSWLSRIGSNVILNYTRFSNKIITTNLKFQGVDAKKNLCKMKKAFTGLRIFPGDWIDLLRMQLFQKKSSFLADPPKSWKPLVKLIRSIFFVKFKGEWTFSLHFNQNYALSIILENFENSVSISITFLFQFFQISILSKV